MKVTPSLPTLTGLPVQIRRFGLPLFAALLLHGLWWSLLQLRHSRLPAPPVLAVRDDTPELLRFSRRQEPLVVDVSPIPLPPADPPPPPPVASPPSAGSPPSPRTSPSPSPSPPRRRPQARVQPAPPPPPALLAALAELRRSPPPAGQARPLAAVSAESWQHVWQAARPARTPGGAWSRLPDGVRCRQLPAGFALPRGLPLRHGQGVGLGGEVLLVWRQGSHVWLLRAPGDGPTTDTAPDRDGAQQGAAGGSAADEGAADRGAAATGAEAAASGGAELSPAPSRPAR